MKRTCILAIDQGTTGTRAILYGPRGNPLGSAYREFRQYFPQPGWVEHDADEIWRSVLTVIKQALRRAGKSSSSIASIGITNQRETTVLWHARTGRPVCRAIVWQDRRTASICARLKRRGREKAVRAKTGLVLDPYFSGTKLQWLLDHHKGLRNLARRGDLRFGTMDTWLLWKLTGGQSHATDYTNASRTLLFDIKKKRWDPRMLRIFNVPKSVLPAAHPSGHLFGKSVGQGPLQKGIPIYAIMGDQQAALYGQACYMRGQAKNTYGTGCFVVMNLGKAWRPAPYGLLMTLAADEGGNPVYALEGSIFIGGAVVQWLRDGLKLFKTAQDSEALAQSVKDNGGVVLVPAFVGLGAPYWNADVRGRIAGLTRGTTRAHLVRAALESMCHQTADVIDAMKKYAGIALRDLKVDGGATQNRLMMQCQADFLRVPVRVSDIAESTAWGVAKLAGKKAGLWKSLRALDRKRKYRTYRPGMAAARVRRQRRLWAHEIQTLSAPPPMGL